MYENCDNKNDNDDKPVAELIILNEQRKTAICEGKGPENRVEASGIAALGWHTALLFFPRVT